MSAMPKFDFSKSTLKTAEELNKALDGTGRKESLYLDSGMHDVAIIEAKYSEKVLSDPSWRQLHMTVEGAGKKTIKTSVLIPTSSFEYSKNGGTATLFPFKKFVEFCAGLGFTPVKDADSAVTVLTEYFAKPEKSLVGRETKVTIGYLKNHIHYDGKDEIGQRRFIIKMGDGSTLLNKATGKVMAFSDRDSAMAHAEQNQIDIQKYPDVTGYANLGRKKTANNDF